MVSREKLEDGRFRVVYPEDFRDDSFADVVTDWLKEHGERRRARLCGLTFQDCSQYPQGLAPRLTQNRGWTIICGRLACLPTLLRRVLVAQNFSHSRLQFRQAGGFDEVLGGPQVKSLNQVLFVFLRGNHHHRDRGEFRVGLERDEDSSPSGSGMSTSNITRSGLFRQMHSSARSLADSSIALNPSSARWFSRWFKNPPRSLDEVEMTIRDRIERTEINREIIGHRLLGKPRPLRQILRELF